MVAVPLSWVAGWGRLPRPSYFLVHSHDDYHSPEASPVHHHKQHSHANVRHILALTASSRWIWVLWFHLGFLHPLDPEQNLWGLSGTSFLWAGCPFCHPTNDVNALRHAIVQCTKSAANTHFWINFTYYISLQKNSYRRLETTLYALHLH